jgi:DNA-binding IclR family transcriptional regulator
MGIVHYLTGLSLAELSSTTNLSPTELTATLKILERHDVAACDQEKWRISIELFRRWVVDYAMSI